jgi:biotin carboxylase
MKHVVFVAPFLLDATVRFVNAVAGLRNTKVGLISQDATDRLAPSLRSRIDGHYRVDNAMDADQLTAAVLAMKKHLGRVDTLMGTLEQIQEQLAVVRERTGIDGIRPDAARNFRDKSQMKHLLRAAGIPCARHALCQSREDVSRFVASVGYPVVLKPQQGAAAVATYRVDSEDSLNAALGTLAPSAERPCVAEEFIVGEERSFETISIRGNPVWHSGTLYTPTPLTVLENPWIQWTVTLPRETDTDNMRAIAPAGRAALKALGMTTGISHMEWFRRRDGSVAVSEIAARPPGAQIMTLNSYAHDADFYSLYANLMVNEEFAVGERKYAVGCAFFRAQGTGSKVVALKGIEQAQREVGQWIVEAKLPRVGQQRSTGYEGEGYAIVRHPETEVVEFALKRLVSQVRVVAG